MGGERPGGLLARDGVLVRIGLALVQDDQRDKEYTCTRTYAHASFVIGGHGESLEGMVTLAIKA